MFTGLIECQALVVKVAFNNHGMSLRLKPRLPEGMTNFSPALGDSIAVNGACLTVSELFKNDELNFELSSETLAKANFKDLKVGSLVNLERAMLLSTRLNGHLVSGHVDSTCVVIFCEKKEHETFVQVKVFSPWHRYLIAKGSITLQGVSLTINELVDIDGGSVVSLMLIEHTRQVTTFASVCIGDLLNLEVDMMAKYAERFRSYP